MSTEYFESSVSVQFSSYSFYCLSHVTYTETTVTITELYWIENNIFIIVTLLKQSHQTINNFKIKLISLILCSFQFAIPPLLPNLVSMVIHLPPHRKQLIPYPLQMVKSHPYIIIVRFECGGLPASRLDAASRFTQF